MGTTCTLKQQRSSSVWGHSGQHRSAYASGIQLVQSDYLHACVHGARARPTPDPRLSSRVARSRRNDVEPGTPLIEPAGSNPVVSGAPVPVPAPSTYPGPAFSLGGTDLSGLGNKTSRERRVRGNVPLRTYILIMGISNGLKKR